MRTYIPSPIEQEAFARQIVGNISAQSGTLVEDKGGFEFYTHKQLHTVGMVNLGVKLDEIMSDVSSVSYGRVGLLIVESDTDLRDVKSAIDKVLADEPLSPKETNVPVVFGFPVDRGSWENPHSYMTV